MTAEKRAVREDKNASATSLAASGQATPRNSSTTKTDEQPGPHFINITDALSLDDTSKTEVRVQVMREYHRRRKQAKTFTAAVIATPIAPKAPLSAESQTQKFRFGREKILQPWIRVKPYVGKKIQAASQKPGGSQKSPPKAPFSRGLSRQETVRKAERSEAQFVEVETRASLVHAETDVENDTPLSSDPELPGAQQWLPTLDSSLETTILYQNPAPGVLDPFSAMSLLIIPRTQQLLHYYFNVRLATSWLMMPMRKGLFSLALHDAALFHTFMSHYVAAYNLRSSTGDPAESIQHRTEAIRIVNERLQDPEQALSDGNIAAVANMAVYESSNGSTKSMMVHLNGLVEMVKMRGGIQNGGFAPHVRRLIGWTDLHCASALSTKPRFPPLGIPMIEVPSDASLDFVTDSQDSEYANTSDRIGLDDTFAQIRALSATMAVLRKQSVLPKENIWYSDKIYSLQHRLFDILHSPVAKRDELDAACCIAALIFCATCLRDITFNFRAIENAVTRLKDAIADFLDKHWTPRVDYPLGVKLFWVLGLGGIASEGKQERWWFVEKFRKMAGVLGLKDWESAELVLENVLWQADLNGFGRKLWVEAHGPVW